MWPSAYRTASAPGISAFSWPNGWPAHSPVNASRTASRPPAHDSGADVDRYSFIVMDSHHQLLAGLSAHPIPAVCCGSGQGMSSTPRSRSGDVEIVAHAPIEECSEGARPSLMVNTVRAKLPQKGRTGVRYSWFALVAILAPICGCAVTQPASTPASSSALPTMTVVSGERQRIDFISVLSPDCSSVGYVTVRIIAPPAHGELTTEKGN